MKKIRGYSIVISVGKLPNYKKWSLLSKKMSNSRCSHGHCGKSIKWVDILFQIWLENDKNK